MTDVLTHEEQPSEIVGGEGHGLLTLPDGRSIPFKAHPLADLFPMMSDDDGSWASQRSTSRAPVSMTLLHVPAATP